MPSGLVHGVKALEAGRLVDSFTPQRADFLVVRRLPISLPFGNRKTRAPLERRGFVAWALVAPRYSKHHRRTGNMPDHGENKLNARRLSAIGQVIR